MFFSFIFRLNKNDDRIKILAQPEKSNILVLKMLPHVMRCDLFRNLASKKKMNVYFLFLKLKKNNEEQTIDKCLISQLKLVPCFTRGINKFFLNI